MQACPLYLSEMAPSHLRGSLNICFQLATAVGILAANSLNYGEHHRILCIWQAAPRIMDGVMAVTSTADEALH